MVPCGKTYLTNANLIEHYVNYVFLSLSTLLGFHRQKSWEIGQVLLKMIQIII